MWPRAGCRNLVSSRQICILEYKIGEVKMGTYSERIRTKLTAAFAPTQLEIADDSAQHHGHAGAHPDGAGETHFKVMMQTAAFKGKSRLERQRLVHDALALELKERVHALSLKLSAPGES
jgi:BolA protein